MRLHRLALLAAAANLLLQQAVRADELADLRAELQRLSGRIEILERERDETQTALSSTRVSEYEPELVTRLKAVEFQTLAMQRQARQIEALEGVTMGASLLSLTQVTGSGNTAQGSAATRSNYRGDLSLTLPGGTLGLAEGRMFAHLRIGQGSGIGLRPTYSSTVNTTAFEVGNKPADDSFGVLAQAWYQLTIPIMHGGPRINAREFVHLTAGKIDPFVFFDQNAAADDESLRFIGNTFVHNPLLDSGGDTGADRYGFAPGVVAQYVNERQRGREWGLTLGAFAAGRGANFTGSPGDPFLIAQIHKAARPRFLPGNYRAYVWHNGRGADYEGSVSGHAGVGVSIDQRLTDALTVFVRYGQQLDGQVRFDRAATLGLELRGNRWGRAADGLGVALGALHTSTAFRRDSLTLDADCDGVPDYGYAASGWEQQAEVYYRYQLNDHIEIAPDLQLIARPGGDNAADLIAVWGLRARFGF